MCVVLCARADAVRPKKLSSALPPGDQRRSEAIGTDTIHYAQTNIWVRNICVCWPCGREMHLYCAIKGQRKKLSLAFAELRVCLCPSSVTALLGGRAGLGREGFLQTNGNLLQHDMILGLNESNSAGQGKFS